jgi:hypothetical protein
MNGKKTTTINDLFKAFLGHAQIGVLPYAVDKVFWLVGSGNFYLSDVRVNTSKHQFITGIMG